MNNEWFLVIFSTTLCLWLIFYCSLITLFRGLTVSIFTTIIAKYFSITVIIYKVGIIVFQNMPLLVLHIIRRQLVINTENCIEHTLILSVSLPKVFLHSVIFEVKFIVEKLKDLMNHFWLIPRWHDFLSLSNIAIECHKSFEKS